MASRPIDSPSNPSTEAMSTARASTAFRVSAPRNVLPSTLAASRPRSLPLLPAPAPNRRKSGRPPPNK
ncbi:hypothetical protein GCM10018954_020450 [Kutzneria kofuensis]